LCDSYNREDLDRTEPELKFTEELDTEVIDGADGSQENRNPDAWVHFISGFPFGKNQSSRGKLVRRSDDVFAPSDIN
jgi:hypothetical protein